ncbi:hypothetical protein DL762_010107 [Monosporascus cannonballus]|uniref:Uncharacterized protein n=1 Tax=Monosporascus cannonballus TaxID=155416 RepID=A0ABY0GSD5_9PEZI|nr:hypothetical protein DL762_010107 [Monosporascus cannonballus]
MLLKLITTTLWTSILKYLMRHLRRSNSTTAHDSEHKLPRTPNPPGHGLPEIPSATIRGLRTFIWGSNRRKPVELTDISNYAELRSVNQEYHGHLKNAFGSSKEYPTEWHNLGHINSEPSNA